MQFDVKTIYFYFYDSLKGTIVGTLLIIKLLKKKKFGSKYNLYFKRFFRLPL
jgi:hypothetical protein